MRSLLRTALVLSAATAVLAACTDQPASGPTAPSAPRATVPKGANPLVLTGVCDVNQLKADARSYAAKSNDVLVTYAGDLGGLTRNGLTVASTDKAFDGLARAAFIRGTPAMNPEVTGVVFDRLVRGFLNCSLPVVTANAVEPTPPGGETTGFQRALKSGWVFEVRGKTAAPADPLGGAYERRGSTVDDWWAAWPKTGSWGDAITSTLNDGASPTPHPIPERVLIYGYRTSDPVTGQLGSSFEHFSIPKINQTSFKLTATLGLCFRTATPLLGKQPRLNHDKEFLPLAQALDAQICEDAVEFTPTTGVVALGPMNPIRLAKRAVSFFSPQSLYAATAFFGGGSVTGSPDDFSPSAVWDLSQFELGNPGFIVDGPISQQIHLANNVPVTLTVKITGTTQNAPQGTPVTVSIVGNSSSIAFFQDGTADPSVTVTRPVDANGIVSFDNVFLTKAGGYQLAFQIVFDSVVGEPKFSNSFNMQNK